VSSRHRLSDTGRFDEFTEFLVIIMKSCMYEVFLLIFNIHAVEKYPIYMNSVIRAREKTGFVSVNETKRERV